MYFLTLCHTAIISISNRKKKVDYNYPLEVSGQGPGKAGHYQRGEKFDTYPQRIRCSSTKNNYFKFTWNISLKERKLHDTLAVLKDNNN